MTPARWIVAGIVVAVGVVAFLLFRPDTLFTEVESNESLEEAFETTTTSSPADSTVSSDSTTEVTPGTTEPSSGPVAMQAGEFIGIDHTATGTATVYEQDGKYVLRFEDDTSIQNGPDLYVWLLPSEGFDGEIPEGYIDLGLLKGTVGGQNYELPAGYDPATHRTVLIWCLRFAVPFAAATLA